MPADTVLSSAQISVTKCSGSLERCSDCVPISAFDTRKFSTGIYQRFPVLGSAKAASTNVTSSAGVVFRAKASLKTVIKVGW